MPPPREHVERIRRERFFIGRGERNPLAEDMHQAVNYLSQEIYSKDVHFLMELIQVKLLLDYFFGLLLSPFHHLLLKCAAKSMPGNYTLD
jgi:sacsin